MSPISSNPISSSFQRKIPRKTECSTPSQQAGFVYNKTLLKINFMLIQSKLKESDLHQFSGTEIIYRNPVFGYLYTEGIRYVAIKGEAFWLLDTIGSYQHTKLFKKDRALQEIQFWKFTVDLEKKSGVLTCERDANDIVVTQKIHYTDFPLQKITIYVQNGTLLLPSEY